MTTQSTYLSRRLYIAKGRMIHRLPEGWPDKVIAGKATAGEGLIITNGGWFPKGTYRVTLDATDGTATIREEAS